MKRLKSRRWNRGSHNGKPIRQLDVTVVTDAPISITLVGAADYLSCPVRTAKVESYGERSATCWDRPQGELARLLSLAQLAQLAQLVPLVRTAWPAMPAPRAVSVGFPE